MHTIMLRSGDPNKGKYDVKPELMADDLFDAVNMILSNGDYYA